MDFFFFFCSQLFQVLNDSSLQRCFFPPAVERLECLQLLLCDRHWKDESFKDQHCCHGSPEALRASQGNVLLSKFMPLHLGWYFCPWSEIFSRAMIPDFTFGWCFYCQWTKCSTVTLWFKCLWLVPIWKHLLCSVFISQILCFPW